MTSYKEFYATYNGKENEAASSGLLIQDGNKGIYCKLEEGPNGRPVLKPLANANTARLCRILEKQHPELASRAEATETTPVASVAQEFATTM